MVLSIISSLGRSSVCFMFLCPMSSARLITAFLWICCNVTYATLMWRLTGSAITRAFTLLVTLFILEEFGTSALHPQELIFLMIGVLLHLVVEIEKRKSAPVTFLAVGAIVGGLLLTKINLAAFSILPLLLAALRTTSNENLWRRIRPAALAAGLLMPVILMAPLLRFEWVIRYCVFAEGTIIAAFFVWSSMSIPKIFSVRDWGFAIGGCAMVMLLIISATMASGSTASEILNATILQNFRFATNWYRPAPIDPGVIPVTAVSTIIAMLYALSRTRAVNTKAEIGLVIAALKTGIGCLGCMAIVVAAFFRTPWLFLPPIMFQSVVPFSWLLMVTDQNAAEPRPFARATLGLMAAFLSLYSFPVSGTQTALASLLPTIMLPVLLNDGSRHPDIQRFLKGWLPAALRNRRWHGWQVSAMAYTLMLAMLGSQTMWELELYRSLEPLDLPGASLLRADHKTAQLYRWAVGELVKCPAFYSLPNLSSLYFWTNQIPPTGTLNNDILSLLSFEEQQQLITDLEPHKELCILMFPKLLDFFDRGQLATKPPLLEYIKENFIEVESNGPFQLLHRKWFE